jgi:hypothetical protein
MDTDDIYQHFIRDVRNSFKKRFKNVLREKLFDDSHLFDGKIKFNNHPDMFQILLELAREYETDKTGFVIDKIDSCYEVSIINKGRQAERLSREKVMGVEESEESIESLKYQDKRIKEIYNDKLRAIETLKLNSTEKPKEIYIMGHKIE